MAQHVVSRDQLQLLVDPEEHMRRIRGSTDEMGQTVHHVWRQKEAEARMPKGARNAWGDKVHGAGLYDALRGGEQVRKPIHVVLEGYHGKEAPIQWEGHHRVAAAAAVQRENKAAGKAYPHVYLPVEHHADMEAALGARWGINQAEQTGTPTTDEDYYSPTPATPHAWTPTGY